MDRIVHFPALSRRHTITAVWRGLHGDSDGVLQNVSGVWR